MKMRLRPLRGQTYESTEGPVKFLEQVADSGIEIQVQGDNKQKWFCVIYKNEEGFPEAIAKSAPMAICLAFLKLP